MSGSVLDPPLSPKEKSAVEQVLGDQAQVRRGTKILLEDGKRPTRSRQVLKKYTGHLYPWQHAVYLGPRIEGGNRPQ